MGKCQQQGLHSSAKRDALYYSTFLFFLLLSLLLLPRHTGLKLTSALCALVTIQSINNRYQITCDLDIEGLQRNAKANLLLTLQAKQQLQLRLKRRTRRAVVVVDMQIDFSGTGRLGTGAAFDGMVPIVNCVLNNHEWTSVVFLQLMRQYSDFERELRREAAQYVVASFLASERTKTCTCTGSPPPSNEQQGHERPKQSKHTQCVSYWPQRPPLTTTT